MARAWAREWRYVSSAGGASVAVALCEQRAVGASVVRVCASIIACGLAIGSGRPATTSGVAILGACSRSGHVADAQVGEIPGFARQPPPTGVAEMSASGHRLRHRRR